MLKRTEKGIIYIFGGIILFFCIFLVFYFFFTTPVTNPASNRFLSDVSLFQTHGDKNVLFVIHWKQIVKEKSASDKNNFSVEQVTLSEGEWENLSEPKKTSIEDIQYVYSAWVDSKEKRRNSSGPAEKVTQLFVKIDPREQVGDYYRVKVNGIEPETGEVLKNPEFVVVKVTKFNKLIKR